MIIAYILKTVLNLNSENVDINKQLVKHVLQGRPEFFSDLVKRNYSRVYNYVVKMGASKEDAEDIAQEVFIKVYKNLYRYNEKWSFVTWILTIAKNTFTDFLRKKNLKTVEINEERIPSNMNEKEDEINEFIVNEKVKKLFSELNNKTKTIMILRFFHNLSFKEIAQTCRMSEKAVSNRVYRTCRGLMKKYGMALKGSDFNEM